MNEQRKSHVPALVLVGLGMLLVTSLATLAVWLVVRRRERVLTGPVEVVNLGSPAEA